MVEEQRVRPFLEFHTHEIHVKKGCMGYLVDTIGVMRTDSNGPGQLQRKYQYFMKSNPKQDDAKVRILITGGTFDKEYNEITGNLYFKDTHVQEILSLGRSQVPVAIRTLMLVDSLDLLDSDRQIILDQCLKSPEKRIVITHGTDTMVDTARFLGPHIQDRTIILTGAMIPYTFGSSDGLFNLGSALAYAQTLPPGVYIAMNGRSFFWDNVIKNRQLGRFEPLQ